MAEADTTVEELKAELAKERERIKKLEDDAKKNSASLSDVTDSVGSIFGAIGSAIKYTFIAAIIAPIILAASGPISQLIGSFNEDWGKSVDSFFGGLKLQLKEFGIDLGPLTDLSEAQKTALFTPENVKPFLAKELAASIAGEGQTPTNEQNTLAERLAGAIAPDQVALNKFQEFAKQNEIDLWDKNQRQQLFSESNMKKLMTQNPEMMQRVVKLVAKSAGAGTGAQKLANLPDIIKTPLKSIVGNPDALQALINDSRQEPWLKEAFALGGIDENSYGQMLGLLRMKTEDGQPLLSHEDIASLARDMLDGKDVTQTLDSLKQRVKEQFKELAPEQKQELVAKNLEDVLAEKPELKSFIGKVEEQSPDFKTELIKALVASNGDSPADTVLALITKDPAHIGVLHDLTPVQMQSLLSEVGLSENHPLVPLLTNQDMKPAAIDLLQQLAKIDAANPNASKKLGDILNTKTPTVFLTNLSDYLAQDGNGTGTANQPRHAAFEGFTTAIKARAKALRQEIEASKQAGGAIDPAKAEYATGLQDIAIQYDGVLGNIEQVAITATVIEQAPDPVKVLLGQVDGNPQAIFQAILTDATFRAQLLAPATKGAIDQRALLHQLGDTLAQLQSELNNKNPMLSALLVTTTLSDGRVIYPNLQAFVKMAEWIDDTTGVDSSAELGIAMLKNNGTSIDQTMQDLAQREKTADKNTMALFNSLLALGGVSGQAIKKSEEAADPEYDVYRVETEALGAMLVNAQSLQDAVTKPVTALEERDDKTVPKFKQNETVQAMQAFLKDVKIDDLPAETQNAITALRQHFWVDENKDGQVDKGEGAASFLYTPERLATLMHAAATGEKGNPFEFNETVASFLNTSFLQWTSPAFTALGITGDPQIAIDGKHLQSMQEMITQDNSSIAAAMNMPRAQAARGRGDNSTVLEAIDVHETPESSAVPNTSPAQAALNR